MAQDGFRTIWGPQNPKIPGSQIVLLLYPTIIATYAFLFCGLDNFTNRARDAAGLYLLLQETKGNFYELLQVMQHHGIQEDRVFGLVVDWVTQGCYAELLVVKKRFFYQFPQLIEILGLHPVPERDAPCRSLSFYIHDLILTKLQEMIERALYDFLRANFPVQLQEAYIETARQFEISLERKKQFLDPNAFWQKVNLRNKGLTQKTLMTWIDAAVEIRNAAVHRNEMGLGRLIAVIGMSIKLINALGGSQINKERLQGCMSALKVWEKWIANDNAESLEELLNIEKLLSQIHGENKPRFRTEKQSWTLKILEKRLTDREPYWPPIFDHMKGIFDGKVEHQNEFYLPSHSRTPLSTASLTAKLITAKESHSDQVVEVKQETGTNETVKEENIHMDAKKVDHSGTNNNSILEAAQKKELVKESRNNLDVKTKSHGGNSNDDVVNEKTDSVPTKSYGHSPAEEPSTHTKPPSKQKAIQASGSFSAQGPNLPPKPPPGQPWTPSGTQYAKAGPLNTGTDGVATSKKRPADDLGGGDNIKRPRKHNSSSADVLNNNTLNDKAS